MRCYPLFRLTSWPTVIPQMLAEDTRLLNLKLMMLLLRVKAAAKVSGSLSSHSHYVMSRELGDMLACPMDWVMKGCCWAANDTGILGLRRRGTPSGASDLAPSLALERDTLFFKAVCKNSVSAYKMGRNVRGSWTVVSKQLPKAYKKSSLITGNTQKMLRHLCSVDHKCRPALNLQEVMPWEQEVVINSEKVTVIFH